MAVTIDELQIEIKSSSTNAASGIDALATSLGNLKKSGTITTVIKNLNNLSDALNRLPNVHQSANALRTLANSIEKLKSVGSVASLGNSLKKLPEAFKAVGNINLDRVGAQMQEVASAVAPLSAVKAGGLNTMVNALTKLGKVTESLDDDTIAAFAQKVELLNQKLAPLSEKMTTIKAGFNAISTGARKAGSSMSKLGEDVNASALNMASFIEIARTAVETLQNMVQGFSNLIDEAIQWDGIAARFGRGFGAQAQENFEWIQRLNEELGINIQEFMKYSSVYSTMLSGFGVASKDAGTMAMGYMELTYDIWAGYNDVYGSLEEAAEAVKSAIAGEVEPVRRAGFTIVEATLAQTAANHGLEISLANATEAQKSYLRYLTLVDQAHAQNLVGTYAKEMNTAEGMMRALAQQLKSLTQAFGSLFLPILVRVIPYVQAFVELLSEGVYWLANLFGIEIQPATWGDYNSGVSDAVENTENVTGALNDATAAAKELKNAAIGIDELNVISPNSASGGAGSGGGAGGGAGGGSGFDGLDIESLWDESIFDNIQSNVDEIKEKLKDWLPVVGGIATLLAGLKLTNLLDDIELADFKLKNLGKAVSVAGIAIIVGKLVWDFTGAYLEGGDEADLMKAIGTTTLGVALARYLAGKPGAAFTLLVSGVVMLTRLAVELEEGTVEWNDTEAIVTAIVGGLQTAIGAVFTWKTFAPMIKSAWPKIASAATPILAKAGPYGWIAAAVIAGITLALVDYDFTDIGRTLGEKVGTALADIGKWIWDAMKKGFEWLKDALDIEDIWDVLAILFIPGEWIRRISPEIEEVFDGLGEWINDKIENLKGNINEFFGGFFDGLFDGLGIDTSWADKFTEMFDIEYLDIIEMIMNPKSIGSHIWTGIKNGIDGSAPLSAIKDKLSSMWEEAKTWWNDKKGALSSYTPSIGNISTALSTAWTAAKDWWNTKRSSLSYTPSIGKIWENLKTAWTTAKDWWSKNRSNLSYTPSIGKIWENLKTAWTSAKDWWNKSRSSLSYTPSIGSISTKLSTAWTSAKNWWNKNRSSLSYTPSIGSIKDKIVSAWNTAKSWWNSNASLSTKLNVSVPKITVKWETASAFGKEFRYPTGFSLKFAANGGIFDQGSLIWAGERGPEVMANAGGGKTGIMNVQQMSDAVYEGVYAAVTAAMRGTGGGSTQEVNVYLDGRQITAAVEQRQRERGASLMGNGVYSY